MSDHVIAFNIPYVNGSELDYIRDAIEKNSFSGNGDFTRRCEERLEAFTGTEKCLLTSSCSHALDMCAILLDIKPGDEVIMASFNFVSAANAFVSRGARICFVDIDPKTMNMDVDMLASAINDHTKAVLVMHYGGIACQMDAILELTQKHHIYLIEDAAHCIGAYHHDKHLGTIGDLGTISFHSSKNIHCGEGGALLVNNSSFISKAEIIREKGTNRKAFFDENVDKYSWVSLGSSYLMSDLSAAFLLTQLNDINRVNNARKTYFLNYYNALKSHLKEENISPLSPHANYHLFYIKSDMRDALITYLNKQNIQAHFHYTPLHTSKAGLQFGYFHGEDQYTSSEAARLLRLPLYMQLEHQADIIEAIINFIHERGI